MKLLLCFFLGLLSFVGQSTAVSICKAGKNRAISSPWVRNKCRPRAQELLKCKQTFKRGYCPSFCVPHNRQSTCRCRSGSPDNCVIEGYTPGWTGLRGEIKAHHCADCDSAFNLPCQRYSPHRMCNRKAEIFVHCLTWEECSEERQFPDSVDRRPCPNGRHGPVCAYEEPRRRHFRVQLFDWLSRNESKNFSIPLGRPALVKLEFDWSSWRHREDLTTSQIRLVASSGSALQKAPCIEVSANKGKIQCTWNITYHDIGTQMFLVNFSFPHDHTYTTFGDILHRIPMQGRVLSYPVVVTKGEDECYAVGAELRGISQNPEIEFYHERSRKLLVEGYFSPPEACAVSLSSIEFCWAVNHAPYISWQNASLEYPLPMSCNDVILNCEEISQMPKRLILEAFSLSYGFYTIQYGISLNRDPDQGPVIQKCTTGYVTVAPSPLRVVIKGGTQRVHIKGMPLKLELLEQIDLDVPAGHATNYLTYSWSCTTMDSQSTACQESMEDDSRVTDSGTQLIVTDGEFDPNFEYNFTVSVRDIRMEVGRKSVEYTQTVRVVDEPIPVITITCDKYCDNHYIHPGDRWVLHANCDSCLAYPVPVFYRWIITRTGGPPDEFNWASSTEAGTNEGENLRTIEVLPNMLKPGAEYKVEVMAKYEPKTMEDYENLRALVESQQG